MVACLLRRLGSLQDALPEEREASPAIALALEELRTGDMPFDGAVAQGQGDPRGDRGRLKRRAVIDQEASET
jgi:hypothetical protein